MMYWDHLGHMETGRRKKHQILYSIRCMQGVAFFGEGGAGQSVNDYFAIDIPFHLFLWQF